MPNIIQNREKYSLYPLISELLFIKVSLVSRRKSDQGQRIEREPIINPMIKAFSLCSKRTMM